MTGYTSSAFEKKMDLRQFTLQCARAMGVCVMMRDDDMDKLPTEKSIVESDDYHLNSIKSSEDELAAMLRWPEAEEIEYGEKIIKERGDYDKKSAKEARAVNEYFNGLLVQIVSWEVSGDIVGLKEFMLSQVQETLNWHKTDGKPLYAVKTPLEIYEERVATLKDNIEYHQKALKEQTARNESRVKYLRELQASLPN